MNEEEIRGKLLLPYLADLGFDASQISLETSFTVQIGKSKHKIKGRSDILCKHNKANLFIIELKADSVTITQNDIDQGISYARLLPGNIAPFTIVTNGKTTEIFDSVTRKKLSGFKISEQSSFFKNGYRLDADVDISIRYEALRNFISFSSENLTEFCQHQVASRMGTIIGQSNNRYAKFIKELYVQRGDLQEAFLSFLNSTTATVFGLVGQAGVGKTNAMCSLALQRLSEDFVFFYNAAMINKSPLEHIAQDLNLTFSSRIESDVILRKLDELGRFLDKSVLIFIDAVDENIESNLLLELSEISYAIKSLENVKLCISCKSNLWSTMLKPKNTPTHLFEELAKFHQPIHNLDDCPGFLLQAFNDDEVNAIVPLYQKVFGFTGDISEQVLKALKNGFFLRIFSQVYSNKEIPQEINDRELIKKYIVQSLELTDVGLEIGLRTLSRIGMILLEHKYTSWEAHRDEGMEVESLSERLGYALGEKMPEDLFTRNILIRSSTENSYNISFYYSKIRDYIVCYHSYKIDSLDDSEFYKILRIFYSNHIGQSAISFHLENCSANHQYILAKFIKDHALQYVELYSSYLDEYFPNIKSKFNPHTTGNIGIFLPNDLIHEDGFALFPLPENETSKVQYADIENAFHGSPLEDPLFQKGARTIHRSNLELLKTDIQKTVKNSLFKQLRDIILDGRLTAYNSEALLLEQLSAIVYYYREELGYDDSIKDFYVPRYDLIYPITLQELRERIYKFRVTEHYRQQYLGRELTAIKIAQTLEKREDVPRLTNTGDFPPIEELSTIVQILSSKGYEVIINHQLPYPDVPIREARTVYENSPKRDLCYARIAQFSAKQAKLYIENFVKLFEIAYSQFLEYNFPIHKDKVHFYSTLPHEYVIYLKDGDPFKWGSIGLRHSKSQKVTVSFKDMNSNAEIYEDKEVDVFYHFTLDDLLHTGYPYSVKTIDGLRTSKLDEFCVLRGWIYRFLKHDSQKMFKEIDD